jgi:protein phosphatase
MLELDIGQATDVGRRRDHNEDCIGVFTPDVENTSQPKRGVLLIVADGMGGYAAGDIASSTAVEVVRRVYYSDVAKSIERSIGLALDTANDAVRYQRGRDGADPGRTTVAVATICDDELFFANAGDCRVYLSATGDLQQLTTDHVWVGKQRILYSLGEPGSIDHVAYPSKTLMPGETVVVCSDGLWGMVPPVRIQAILESAQTAQAAADALIVAANEAGGHDNISVIVCRILSDYV